VERAMVKFHFIRYALWFAPEPGTASIRVRLRPTAARAFFGLR
jgi:hypothetical protein